MLQTTDDATGDVCSHARSTIIQSVSQATLEYFLSSFNNLVREAVLSHEDQFYRNRGVQIHAVEVRSISCKDPETQRILMEIIALCAWMNSSYFVESRAERGSQQNNLYLTQLRIAIFRRLQTASTSYKSKKAATKCN